MGASCSNRRGLQRARALFKTLSCDHALYQPCGGTPLCALTRWVPQVWAWAWTISTQLFACRPSASLLPSWKLDQDPEHDLATTLAHTAIGPNPNTHAIPHSHPSPQPCFLERQGRGASPKSVGPGQHEQSTRARSIDAQQIANRNKDPYLAPPPTPQHHHAFRMGRPGGQHRAWRAAAAPRPAAAAAAS